MAYVSVTPINDIGSKTRPGGESIGIDQPLNIPMDLPLARRRSIRRSCLRAMDHVLWLSHPSTTRVSHLLTAAGLVPLMS